MDMQFFNTPNGEIFLCVLFVAMAAIISMVFCWRSVKENECGMLPPISDKEIAAVMDAWAEENPMHAHRECAHEFAPQKTEVIQIHEPPPDRDYRGRYELTSANDFFAALELYDIKMMKGCKILYGSRSKKQMQAMMRKCVSNYNEVKPQIKYLNSRIALAAGVDFVIMKADL